MKVLGFDNWTGGAHLFERLVPAFSAAGLDLSLLHLGSWGNDPGRPVHEQFGSLSVWDISYFGEADYKAILRKESPDAVLFMSTDTFAHRAFNRYCRQLKIPTVHVYHGVVSVQDTTGDSMYRVNALAQLRFATSRLGKALMHVWPVYAKALWETNASAVEWIRFVADIIKLTRGSYIKVSARDARTDMCGVYTDADQAHAINKYGFNRMDVVAVGNPDLLQFGVGEKDIGACARETDSDYPDVMYVDTGLVYTGWIFDSEQDFIDHLLVTQNELARTGRKFVFKPHPQHHRGTVLQKLASAGVAICGREDFVSRLKRCCACIVEPSSAALIPALLGLPLLLGKYGKLAGCHYGELLLHYPRSRLLARLTDFEKALGDVKKFNSQRISEWIQRNAGPQPPELMPDRVATLVLAAMHKQRAS